MHDVAYVVGHVADVCHSWRSEASANCALLILALVECTSEVCKEVEVLACVA